MAESILLYVSTDDGLIILSKPGTSKEWLPPRRALPGEPIGAAAAVPGPPIQVFAARRSAGSAILLSANGGRTWDPAPAGADPLAVLPTDPVPPTIAAPLVIPAMKQGIAPIRLIVAEGELQRSEDEGATWSVVPVDPAATSADRGKTWTRLEVPPLPPINHIFVLRIG
jgi:hypothetical protein